MPTAAATADGRTALAGVTASLGAMTPVFPLHWQVKDFAPRTKANRGRPGCRRCGRSRCAETRVVDAMTSERPNAHRMQRQQIQPRLQPRGSPVASAARTIRVVYR